MMEIFSSKLDTAFLAFVAAALGAIVTVPTCTTITDCNDRVVPKPTMGDESGLPARLAGFSQHPQVHYSLQPSARKRNSSHRALRPPRSLFGSNPAPNRTETRLWSSSLQKSLQLQPRFAKMMIECFRDVIFEKHSYPISKPWANGAAF
jgi:hypothetical protein